MTNKKEELNNLIKFYNTYKERHIENNAMGNKLIILNNFLEQIIHLSKDLNIDSTKYELEKQNIKKELDKYNITVTN